MKFNEWQLYVSQPGEIGNWNFSLDNIKVHFPINAFDFLKGKYQLVDKSQLNALGLSWIRLYLLYNTYFKNIVSFI